LTFVVIFTKRATSIIATGDPIFPHPAVTQSLDYEGELAVIIGKGGSQISKENAWQHVWGATIVNDVRICVHRSNVLIADEAR
jgi:2-keto-4-pentenoate hydratase/2-oxohepta-3-ene-1,7-dioic acid hydratase in catechol pathway